MRSYHPLHHEREGLQAISVPQEPNLYISRVSDRASFTHIFRSRRGWYLSLSAMKMTLLSRSREAKTLTKCRTLREENRDSKSTCSSRESRGRHSSITCQETVAAMKGGLVIQQASLETRETDVVASHTPGRAHLYAPWVVLGESCLLKACYCWKRSLRMEPRLASNFLCSLGWP